MQNNLTPEAITAIENMKRKQGQPYDARVVDVMDATTAPPMQVPDLSKQVKKGIE